MAAAVTAAVSFPCTTKSTNLSSRPSISPDKISYNYKKISLQYNRGNGSVGFIRAQITTDAPPPPVKVEKVSKKMEEGVVTNKFRPKEPYTGRCLLNTKITGDDAPGETWHMVFSTEGELPYREGQSVGVIPDGIDKNGKPHKVRLYSIASSALGDFGDSKTVSLCVKRLVYTNDQGEVVKGVCSNFLCDLKPGSEVKLTGPVGKEMLMPKDRNATIIMLATGTGIAPFRLKALILVFVRRFSNTFSHIPNIAKQYPSPSPVSMAMSVPAASIRPLNSQHMSLLSPSISGSRLSFSSSQQFSRNLGPSFGIGNSNSISSSRRTVFPVVQAKKQTFSNLDELLEGTDKPVLVDFYATWCGPCQFMVPILNKVSDVLKDKIQVVKIDTEKYPSLADKYRIEALPTFIIFKDGEPCDRFEGALTADQMVQRIEESLKVKQ